MQIYIHIPFCRKKCHYCGFFSEPIGFNDKETDAQASEKDISLNLTHIGVNLFKSKAESEAEKIDSMLQKILPHPKQKKVTANTRQGTGIKSLSDAIPNISKASPQKKGVQSLADVLRGKKETHIVHAEKATLSKATGPTLADALLPQNQAQKLRSTLGLPPLKEQAKPKENTASYLKDTNNSHSTTTSPTSPPTNILQAQSLFLGKQLEHDDLNTVNAHIRSAFSGANTGTLEEAARLPLPLPLPKDFIESNSIEDESLYLLWKKALLAEIKILAEFYADVPITSIFFGGGTPSLIPIKDMDTILRTLIKSFHVTKSAEISMEANPESITKEKAIAYSRMGFNRMSLGIQSLQDDNLQRIGRAHSATNAIKAFHALRDARFHNINIDLMWGLPNQKNKNWRADLKEAINLDPEHISCYGLSIDEGSMFDIWNQDGSLDLPSEKEQALMYKTASDLLENAGYLQYEISNFSKIGHQCRHNLGYWQGNDYMGLGPSAASTIKGIRRTHARSIIEWAHDIQNNSLLQDLRLHAKNTPDNKQTEHPKSKGNFNKEILSQQDKILELIMLRLRTSKGIPLSEYKELTGRSFMNDHRNIIQTLSKHNLLRASKGHVFLTPNGMLVSNSIIERFFDNTKDILKS